MFDIYREDDTKECKEVLIKIKETLGEILIDTQYLEYNLSLCIYYQNILNAFTSQKISYKEFLINKEDADKIYYKVKSSPLGIIIKLASEANIFTHDKKAYETLQQILEKRNELVHTYFKNNDYYKKQNDLLFLKSKLIYLNDFSILELKFNSYLEKLARYYENHLGKIKAVNG